MLSKLALICASIFLGLSAFADSGKKSTNLEFEDLLVKGKFHFSDEAVVTVEQDKVLDALLGIRKDFKDRIEKSSLKY